MFYKYWYFFIYISFFLFSLIFILFPICPRKPRRTSSGRIPPGSSILTPHRDLGPAPSSPYAQRVSSPPARSALVARCSGNALCLARLSTMPARWRHPDAQTPRSSPHARLGAFWEGWARWSSSKPASPPACRSSHWVSWSFFSEAELYMGHLVAEAQSCTKWPLSCTCKSGCYACLVSDGYTMLWRGELFELRRRWASEG